MDLLDTTAYFMKVETMLQSSWPSLRSFRPTKQGLQPSLKTFQPRLQLRTQEIPTDYACKATRNYHAILLAPIFNCNKC